MTPTPRASTLKIKDVPRFTDLLTEFFDYYNKDASVSAMAIRAWIKELGHKISDAEVGPVFERAIATFEFRPSPKKIIDIILGEHDEVLALEEWQQVVQATSSREYNLIISPQGEKALASMGGLRHLSSIETEKLHTFSVKDFVERWRKYKNALDAGTVEPPVPVGNRIAETLSTNFSFSQKKQEPEEPVSPEQFREKILTHCPQLRDRLQPIESVIHGNTQSQSLNPQQIKANRDEATKAYENGHKEFLSTLKDQKRNDHAAINS